MKKFLALCLLLSFAGKIFSQADTTVPATSIKTDYLKKSKTQKTVAWVLLGAGTTMIVAGVVTAGNADYNPYPLPPTDENVYNGAALILIGGLFDLVSIPFFISSANNKHRALSLSFKNDTVPQLQKNKLVKVPLPSVSLVVNF